MNELLTVASSILAFGLTFLAGWFAATDKNRAELFKRRLAAYDSILDELQSLIVLTIASKDMDVKKDDIYSQRLTLIQARFKNTIYLSHDVQQALMEFDMQDKTSDEIFNNFSHIAKLAADDLKISNYNTLSKSVAVTPKEVQLLLQKGWLGKKAEDRF